LRPPPSLQFEFRNGDTAHVTDSWNAELINGGGEGESTATFRIKKDGPYSWIGALNPVFHGITAV